MRLNQLQPAPGSRPERVRVGRGIGSGLGKTSGRGHKGQHARAGGFHKVGFEGGQMPLQRRLPKVGFRSRQKPFVADVRLCDLDKLNAEEINLQLLINAGLVHCQTLRAKVFLKGEISKPLILRGLGVTKGARAAIEAAGGRIEA